MKFIDLHDIDRDRVEFEIEKFVTNNFAVLPVKVVTGNSGYNIEKLKEVIKRYKLEAYKENWINTGAYIIRPGSLN
tara:strand:- start:155 stop:382 length:228 start_codon:yes stop_codon:yes gene_type:complete